jgi:hypothetical protein
VQFRTNSHNLLGKTQRLVDLVGNHDFFHEFLLLHLVDVEKATLQKEFDEEKEQGGFVYDDFHDFFGESWKNDLFEFVKARITPPFAADCHDYINEHALIKAGYTLMYSGALWQEMAESLNAKLKRMDPPAEIRDSTSWQLLLSEKERVREYETCFEHEMADQFEIVRLMRYLPSYFDFMYDLVVEERRQVGTKTLTTIIKKPRRQKKIVQKPIFRIVKSLRISHLAEIETIAKLKVQPRKWTAPSYRYAVSGHWRRLKNPEWKGHDTTGNTISGQTWVREYVRGGTADPVAYETKDPRVVISLKQPLSYARDVIEGHKRDRSAIAAKADLGDSTSVKPSREWMYQERIKLTAGLRWIILRRDGFKCTVCGKGSEDGVKLEVDHIVPIEKWGKTEESNLRALCKDCNRGKGVMA